MRLGGEKKGNITASFGNDLVSQGYTSIPNLVLKYYSKIGVTDSEMMLIIQLLRLKSFDNKPFPSLDQLAECMTGDSFKLKSDLAGLIEKEIISVCYYYDEETGDVMSTYSLEPLFEKISEFWACEKVKGLQQMKKALKEKELKETRSSTTIAKTEYAKVCKTFEKEFGRPMSPMELEQIGTWLEDFHGSSELILEALKRAVFMGKHNFKYIDSILLEWQKNNLKTVRAVLEYENNFRQRQASKGKRGKQGEAEQKAKDKFRLLYL
ncbi:primosome subunit DnaD [Thermincola ferriacetica]|uniref:Primosome subunit DnaD n=1 Tax=Thermincola ferriacetica TaxID=281456 RepID=A0A0L6W764_9FIRM|nr:DnaD domain protein [Thermincola ferriacetica]KNZ70919.1 primosome subunit DnaD [Thermincola ferriacetica]